MSGYSIESSKESIELSKKYEMIYASVGISPNDVKNLKDEDLEIIDNLAKENKVVAIGEIGLDYYWNKENKELQKEMFIKQIDIANKNNLPISIHTREASVDTIQILKEHKVLKTGIFHCCPLNQDLIKEALKLGFYISFAGPITFKNVKNADEVIKLVPLNKLLIETDSPYLSPEPNRGKRNNPINVEHIAQKIADITGKTIEEIAEITFENARKIYNIKDSQ